jgi:predicted house-cleaning noncanonical NTP pyrophosphatase (MazG superfamily)
MKPKKLIRKFITDKLKEGEWETITDQNELNQLYAFKVREELAEIQESDHKDIMEFVDLIQVAFSFAKQNGFTHEQLSIALVEKSINKGSFGRLALNNLNPNNPSNKLYFENKEENRTIEKVLEENNIGWQSIHNWIHDKGYVIVTQEQYDNLEVIDSNGAVP